MFILVLVFYTHYYSGIHLHVHVLVELRGEVTRHLPTAVIIPVIFRDVIHIVKNHTVPAQVFHCLLKAHIKQHGSIKRLRTCLGNKKHQQTTEEETGKGALIYC